jgi:DnaJ-class molecular chaperone
MPIRSTGEFGELHVKMLVNFPKKLTPQQIQLVEHIFPADGNYKTWKNSEDL